jgi:hypothetical protein
MALPPLIIQQGQLLRTPYRTTYYRYVPRVPVDKAPDVSSSNCCFANPLPAPGNMRLQPFHTSPATLSMSIQTTELTNKKTATLNALGCFNSSSVRPPFTLLTADFRTTFGCSSKLALPFILSRLHCLIMQPSARLASPRPTRVYRHLVRRA